jgi:hypothetical protein
VADRQPVDRVGDADHVGAVERGPLAAQVVDGAFAGGVEDGLGARGEERQQAAGVVGEHRLEQRVVGGRRQREGGRGRDGLGGAALVAGADRVGAAHVAVGLAQRERLGEPVLGAELGVSVCRLTPAARATSAIRALDQPVVRAASAAASSSSSRVVGTTSG